MLIATHVNKRAIHSKAIADHNAKRTAASTLLDRYETARRIKVSVWTLGKMVKSGLFPKPIRVTYNTYGWTELEVAEWLEKQRRVRWEERPLNGRAKQLVERKEGLRNYSPRVR
jgi:predicted DNA-binding transcriptional regulator AlpA